MATQLPDPQFSENQSDGSSSESDEGMEENYEDLIKDFERKISENPTDYDAHVGLISSLRRTGELNKLRIARQGMAAQFPLTPEMWLEWVKDERDLSSPEDLKQLFQRALGDYVSLELWLEYCQWSLGTGDVKLSRDIFERAVSVCGLHVKQGSIIWDVYREFEISILSLCKEETEKLEQTDRIRKLFQRQLAIPLMNMEETWSEYRQFLHNQTDSDANSDEETAYRSALTRLGQLIPFEEALDAASKAQKITAYYSYLEHERKEKSKNPGRIKLLFERAITDCCLDEHLWVEYLSWMDRYLRQHQEILPAYSRAVRNCDWSTSIWQRYLLALERAGKDWPEMDSVFAQALSRGLGDAPSGVHLWLNYIYMIRRRESKRGEVTSGVEVDNKAVSEAFQRGKESLTNAFSDAWDSECYYRKSWAYFEASRRDNMELARKLWGEEIMRQGNGPFAASWLDYFELERQFGGEHRIQNCRKILTLAVNSVTDYSDAICHKFLQFEREEGSLADYDVAQQKVESRLKQVASMNKARKKVKWEESKNWSSGSHKHSPVRVRNEAPQSEVNKKPDKKLQAKKPVQNPNKRRMEPVPEETSRELQGTPVKAKKDNDGFAIPLNSPVLAKKPQAKQDQEKKKVTFADNNIPEKMETSVASDSGSQKKPEIDTSKYDRTVFVSNLKFAVDESRLKAIFAPLGDITDCRIARQAGHRSKGFGFVEFKAPGPAKKALELDRTPVDGRPMYVSKAEDKAAHPTQFRYATNLEKTKLFVKGIAKNVTESELRKVFAEHGNMKGLRLVTQRDGSSKGIAFVEYNDEASASQALMKTDGLAIAGQQIEVALSNPPPKGQKSAGEHQPYQFHTGGQPGSSGGRISHSSKLQLTPRALSGASHKSDDRPKGPVKVQPKKDPEENKVEENGNAGSAASDLAQKAKLSNDQFRNLFLKKD